MSLQNWLWIGFYGMAAGSVVLLLQGWGRRTREEENHFFLHLFVTLTATASYLAMALGQGSVMLADGRDFYFARYLDWAITTPMLLTGLSLTALSSPFRRWALLLGLVFTDVYMILTGVMAGLSPAGSGAKWLWYLISSGAFVFIYIGLWGPMRAEAVKSGSRAAALYTSNATILSLVWLAYPIVFLVGSEGTRSIDATTTGALYTLLDLIAKVAYGMVSLAGSRRKGTAELADGETPAHDMRPAEVAYHEIKEPGRTALTPPGTPSSPTRR